MLLLLLHTVIRILCLIVHVEDAKENMIGNTENVFKLQYFWNEKT